MILMTRIVGRAALERIHRDGDRLVKGLRPSASSIRTAASSCISRGARDRELRQRLRRQCTAREEVPRALRIASYQARTEGWLADHMLIVGLRARRARPTTSRRRCRSASQPDDVVHESMPGCRSCHGRRRRRISPRLRCGADGRLYAINPEAGYLSIVRTNTSANRNAYEMIKRDTLFTNVALTADKDPVVGRPRVRHAGDRLAGSSVRSEERSGGPSRIRASRVSAERNPGYSPEADSPRGVPISAIISAATTAASRRWSTRRATGRTACWSAPRSRRRPQPRPRARPACCAATRWP